MDNPSQWRHSPNSQSALEGAERSRPVPDVSYSVREASCTSFGSFLPRITFNTARASLLVQASRAPPSPLYSQSHTGTFRFGLLRASTRCRYSHFRASSLAGLIIAVLV